MYKGKIPFNENGSVLHYPRIYGWNNGKWQESDVIWKDNYHFDGTIRLVDKLNTGRSAKYLTIIHNSIRHPMFIKDFVQATIMFGSKPGGELTGTWCFCKRGTNYGICAYKDK